jgi:hypothetical protein
MLEPILRAVHIGGDHSIVVGETAGDNNQILNSLGSLGVATTIRNVIKATQYLEKWSTS